MIPAALLAGWVAQKHDGQKIKRTAEPYFNHLATVAELVRSSGPLAYEIGLCHDLLEDTSTTADELLSALISFGYSVKDADLITSCVLELTDVFTAAAYPDLSKKARKEKEAERLLSISPISQTVKYADLIYNIGWVSAYDQKHLHKYLLKKQVLLNGLTRGDKTLRQQVFEAFQNKLTI